MRIWVYPKLENKSLTNFVKSKIKDIVINDNIDLTMVGNYNAHFKNINYSVLGGFEYNNLYNQVNYLKIDVDGEANESDIVSGFKKVTLSYLKKGETVCLIDVNNICVYRELFKGDKDINIDIINTNVKHSGYNCIRIKRK